MALSLGGLPIELLDLVLQNLAIQDLLAFARTSKSNSQLSLRSLTTLDLAIFPRRIHSLLAFFDASNDEDEEQESEEESPVSTCWARHAASDKSLYQVGLTTTINRSRPSLSRANTPPSIPTITGKQRKLLHQNRNLSPSPPTPLTLRTAEITSQNKSAATVLSSPSLSNLRTLTVRLYDLNSSALAGTIATQFPLLHTLNLEFSHPYIHDTTLPARYWKETVPNGSPIWNILAGIGEANRTSLRLQNLRSLKLNRSGITSFQLRQWIEANPELREVHLRLCRGVDTEFVDWLSKHVSEGNGQIETVKLTDCAFLECKGEADYDFVSVLAQSGIIRELNLSGCKSVNEDTFLRLANSWSSISKIVSPKGVVIKHRRQQESRCSRSHAKAKEISRNQFETPIVTTTVQRSRAGSVSPALTVSDLMLSGSSSRAEDYGKMEVDSSMAL